MVEILEKVREKSGNNDFNFFSENSVILRTFW